MTLAGSFFYILSRLFLHTFLWESSSWTSSCFTYRHIKHSFTFYNLQNTKLIMLVSHDSHMMGTGSFDAPVLRINQMNLLTSKLGPVRSPTCWSLEPTPQTPRLCETCEAKVNCGGKLTKGMWLKLTRAQSQQPCCPSLLFNVQLYQELNSSVKLLFSKQANV